MRTIKRPRRMTIRKSMRKSMRKARRTTNRKKNNRIKTRRQSGGRFSSFIDANDNKDAQQGKGIDVKVELDETGKPVQWLIGGDGFMDATFKQLQEGAKEGRYQKFITQLLQNHPYFNSFTNQGSSRDSSKGIKLTHALFCQMFINNPNLVYPALIQRFKDRLYACSQSSASSASPFKSHQEAAHDFAFGSTHRQPHPNQTNAAVEQLKSMGFEDDAAIRRALLKTNNNVDAAIDLLLPPSAAPPSATPPRPAARGGVVSEVPYYPPPSAAQISAAQISAAPPPYYPPPSAAVAAPPNKGPFKTPPCDEYFQFDKWLRDDQFVQPYQILEQKYGIYANDTNMLDISLGWANASYECNNYYIDSFLQYADQTKLQTRGNYEALVMGSFEMEVPVKIKIGQTQKAPDNGWCFYSAVLTAAAHEPNYVRTFAEAITRCMLIHLTQTEDAIKHRVRTLVNGIQSYITVEQLIKLISIPNLTEKNGPCVYPELEQCIGQAAAYLLNKNIIVYDESGNNIGKYRGIDSTNPADQIYLVNTNANHFDIITSHS